jgi:spore coat polysaccharide biosynthesis protein SpsF
MANNMSANVFLQARMSSTRLPGKVLKPLLGKPMLAFQIERIKLARCVDKVVVCTSTETSDDAIFDFCIDQGVDVFRGSLNNVLQRFKDASEKFPSDHVVRLTADCPLSDPDIIDQVISQHVKEKNDFTSNCNPYTLPDGLDVEIMTTSCLLDVVKNADSDGHLEHVTKYIYEHPEQFKLGNFNYMHNYSNNRWTVDYPEDFDFVETVLNHFAPEHLSVGLEEIIQLTMQHPEIKSINSHYIES